MHEYVIKGMPYIWFFGIQDRTRNISIESWRYFQGKNVNRRFLYWNWWTTQVPHSEESSAPKYEKCISSIFPPESDTSGYVIVSIIFSPLVYFHFIFLAERQTDILALNKHVNAHEHFHKMRTLFPVTKHDELVFSSGSLSAEC